MLEDCLFASRPSARTKKPATLVLSVLVHGALAVTLILIPLFQSQMLPQVQLFEPLQPPVAPARSVELVPVPRPSGRPAAPSATPQNSMIVWDDKIPTKIEIVNDLQEGPVGYLRNTGAGPGGPGGPGGLFGAGGPIGDPFGTSKPLAGPPPPPPPAPPPPAPEPKPTGPIRVSRVDPSSLIHTVQPVYPRLAVITKVSGKVVIEAVITGEGTIDPSRIRVLSTEHTFLTQAAVDAVKQWRYKPLILNGEPVEILTTITVNFTLN